MMNEQSNGLKIGEFEVGGFRELSVPSLKDVHLSRLDDPKPYAHVASLQSYWQGKGGMAALLGTLKPATDPDVARCFLVAATDEEPRQYSPPDQAFQSVMSMLTMEPGQTTVRAFALTVRSATEIFEALLVIVCLPHMTVGLVCTPLSSGACLARYGCDKLVKKLEL